MVFCFVFSLSPEVKNSEFPTYALRCDLFLYFSKMKCHDGIFRLVNSTDGIAEKNKEKLFQFSCCSTSTLIFSHVVKYSIASVSFHVQFQYV